MIRSVGAVLIGYAMLAIAVAVKLWVLRKLAPDVLPAVGEDVFPNTPWLLTILASDVALIIAAGYVTAVMTPHAPVPHAVALGGVVVLLGLVWMFVFWGWLPLWYQVVLISIAVPAAATGGSLGTRSG